MVFWQTKNFKFEILQGGVSSGYKNFIAENGIADDTYTEDGLALFRVQGSGPDNMQAIQVEPVNAAISWMSMLLKNIYLEIET